MTRTRDLMMGEYAPQVHALEADLATGSPIGLGRGTQGSSLGDLAAAAAKDLNARRRENLRLWDTSPYRDIREAYSQSRGVVGEFLTRTLFERAFNLTVLPPAKMVDDTPRPDPSFDEMIVRLGRCDSKLSTLSAAGTFQFSSISPTDEDYVMLWGVRPDSIEGWLVPTGVINDLFEMKTAGSKVTGVSRNKHGVFSIAFRADCVPAWLEPYGGDQHSLFSRIRSELK